MFLNLCKVNCCPSSTGCDGKCWGEGATWSRWQPGENTIMMHYDPIKSFELSCVFFEGFLKMSCAANLGCFFGVLTGACWWFRYPWLSWFEGKSLSCFVHNGIFLLIMLEDMTNQISTDTGNG